MPLPLLNRSKGTKISTIEEDSVLSNNDDSRNGVSGRIRDAAKAVSFNESSSGRKKEKKKSPRSSSSNSNGNSSSKVAGSSSMRNGDSKVGDKKQVHWNKKVEKKRHFRIQDLRPNERETIWYTEADTKIILAMAKVTVKMLMRGEECDDVDYCSRGLEGKTPAGSKQRQKNKMRVRQAVLEEQDIQREEGVVDGDYLGDVSRRYSKEVCEYAHQVAVNDENNVREYLESLTLDNVGDSSPMQPMRTRRS